MNFCHVSVFNLLERNQYATGELESSFQNKDAEDPYYDVGVAIVVDHS